MQTTAKDGKLRKASPEVPLAAELAKPSTPALEMEHEKVARLKEAVRNSFRLLSADGLAEPSAQMLDTWQTAIETGYFPVATRVRVPDIRPLVMLIGGLRMLLGAKEQIDRDLAVEVMYLALAEAERYTFEENTADDLFHCLTQ